MMAVNIKLITFPLNNKKKSGTKIITDIKEGFIKFLLIGCIFPILQSFTIFTMLIVISEVEVAIAAPMIPKFGINMKFKVILITAVAKVAYNMNFDSPIATNVTPHGPTNMLKKHAKDNNFKISTASMYSYPKG